MKKLPLLLLLIPFLLTSCENYRAKFDELNTRHTEMERDYNTLKSEDDLRKGEYNATMEALNAIEDTLTAIANRDATMRNLMKQVESETGGMDQRQEVMRKINALKLANERSSASARSLQSKLNSFKIENQQLKDLVEQANRKLDAKEAELKEARGIIDEMNQTLTKLEAQVLEKSGQLAQAYEDLKQKNTKLEETNTELAATVSELKNKTDFISDCAKAYVVCGNKKALRQSGVLKKLNQELTGDYKTAVKKMKSTINFYEQDQIECTDGNITKILPERAAASYRIEGNVLKILDFKTFWATDKVVVLIKED